MSTYTFKKNIIVHTSKKIINIIDVSKVLVIRDLDHQDQPLFLMTDFNNNRLDILSFDTDNVFTFDEEKKVTYTTRDEFHLEDDHIYLNIQIHDNIENMVYDFKKNSRAGIDMNRTNDGRLTITFNL